MRQLSTSATDDIARHRDRSAFTRGYEAHDRGEPRLLPLDLIGAWNAGDWFSGHDAFLAYKGKSL